MEIVVRVIENPSDESINEMVEVLTDAFGTYFGGALNSDPALSRSLLRAHIIAALLDPAGELWIAEEPVGKDVRTVGVAAWHGPGGKWLLNEEQKEKVGWNTIMRSLPQHLVDWWDYFLSAYDDYTDNVFGPGVKLGGYQLQVIGLLKTHQRRGIGGRMLRAVEDKAKNAGVCSCMETLGTSAVPVYRSLGYTVTESVDVKSPSGSGAIPMYGFIKKFSSV